MTVGECLDDFDTRLENNEVRKMRFKVRFTRDDQEELMTYNEIVDFMTRDTILTPLRDRKSVVWCK